MSVYKTEVGKVLQALCYRMDICQKFDELAMFFTCLPRTERRELLGSLIWYFDFKLDEDTVKRFDECLTKINY